MKLVKFVPVLLPLTIILFGLFIYPTIYKYDKLEQKYPVKINRLTGESKILTTGGWIDSGESKIYEDKMYDYKQEITGLINNQNDDISSKVKESIKNEVVKDLQDKISSMQDEITAYKNHMTDPNNRFTSGDTKDTVKKIMGTPDSITSSGPYSTWFYDLSTINFENGKVNGWANTSENLMIK